MKSNHKLATRNQLAKLHSVIQCSAECVKKLPGKCYGFEFNKKTKICSISEEKPISSDELHASSRVYEGKLYPFLLANCKTQASAL